MKKLKILWTGEFDQTGFDEFSKFGTIETSDWPLNPKGERLSEEKLIEKLKGVDLYICGYDPVNEKVLKASPDLKMILSF